MAREMYLVGVSEDDLKPTPKMEPPRTPKEKWANFWYHNKWLFLGSVFGVIVLAILIGQTLTVNRPDYQVLFVSKYAYLDVQLDPLEASLAKYGRDLDGDGQVEVQVLNCFMGDKGSAEYMANNQALHAHMVSGDVMLFMFEPKQYATYMENIKNVAEGDYSFFAALPFEENTLEEGTVFNWADSPRRGEDAALKQLPEELYFGVRAASGMVAGQTDNHTQAMELLTAYATGEKPETTTTQTTK